PPGPLRGSDLRATAGSDRHLGRHAPRRGPPAAVGRRAGELERRGDSDRRGTVAPAEPTGLDPERPRLRADVAGRRPLDAGDAGPPGAAVRGRAAVWARHRAA